MEHGGFFFHAFIYLAAAVATVPIARRLGLGSVLGYLFAGVLLGPAMLGLVGEAEDVMHIAEFGVVMMLFLIGLELQPQLLWRLRVQILGMGGVQVLLTGAAGAGIAAVAGMPLPSSIALGLILAMSSTAIVLQSLNERGLLRTNSGQSIFSVLLFQDMAVIPILAILPILGALVIGTATQGETDLPWWMDIGLVASVVLGIIVGGRFIIRPMFRFIAQGQDREILTAAALFLVIAIALFTQLAGLSPALGAFLAGVVLADSEYRHELESDIEPFKAILLGLFFISVGAGINFDLIRSRPFEICQIVCVLMLGKALVLQLVARLFHLPKQDRALFSIALAQGGEFTFVLFAYALGQGVFTRQQVDLFIVSVVISMAITPLLFIVYERYVSRLAHATPELPGDKVEEQGNPVIIAGFGGFGQIIGRLLKANGVRTTVFDLDPSRVDLLRQVGLKIYYGDASRVELLHAAGAKDARFFVLAVGDEERSMKILSVVQEHYPHLKILARAVSRPHAYELLRRGVAHVYRDTLGTSLDVGVDLLRDLGFRAYQARRAAQIFKQHDEEYLKELADLPLNDRRYLRHARQRILDLEELLRGDRELSGPMDDGWDPPRPGDR